MITLIQTTVRQQSNLFILGIVAIALVGGITVAADTPTTTSTQAITNPTQAQASSTAFTLSSQAPSTVASGDSFNVTYNINNTGTTDLNSLGLQVTQRSSGLNITNISSADATFISNQQNAVGFPTVSPGENVSATFTVQTNASTSGEQSLSVEATNGFGSDEVTRTQTVNVTVNRPPNADAGSDQTTDENTSVTLNATASSDPNGDPLSYVWTQTAGPSVSLQDANTTSPSFTTPTVGAQTTLSFQVEVSDGNGGTDTDTVNVTVQPVNEPPTADAGPDQTVNENASVTLDATASNDPDGDSLSYAWTQIEGPSVSLENADTANPSFIAPTVDTATGLSFQVEVSDGNGGTDTDTVNVTVQPVNEPPTADAGPDVTFDENTPVTLNATESSDSDNDALSYTWSQTEGPSVSLQDANTATPSFTTPSVNAVTTLSFQVEVSDGNGGTDTDSVNVTVQPVNEMPTADAGPDQIVNENTSVSLNAGNSSDPDNDTLSYTWSQVSGPTITLSGANTATPSFTAPDVDNETLLTLRLEATDENGAVDTDTVNITVRTTNQSPTADAGVNQTVEENTTVQLSALNSSDPDDDLLSYSWVQTGGPSVALRDADSVMPTFIAPNISESTTLTFEVTASDGELNDTDTVSVTVEPVDENRPPTADAGADQTVDEGTTVQLDASGTTDPDGDIVTHNWTQIAGPSVSLSDQFATSPTFTAPTVDTGTTLTFVTRARDGNGGTDTDTVNITVRPVNEPPIADAGPDQTVDENTSVQLNATDSSDPDEDTLTYNWTQTGGSDVVLSDASSATPSFTAPEVEDRMSTTLRFQLEVSDGSGGIDTDTVNITIQPLEPADFVVEELNAPASATRGDTINVSAIITNNGEQTATEPVEFRVDTNGDGSIDDENAVATRNVRLSPGESASVTFDAIDTNGLPTGTLTHGVTTPEDSTTATISIAAPEEPATFGVSNLTAPANATQGEDINLSATVENTGNREGTQSVEFRIDTDGDGSLDSGETIASRDVTLSVGERTTVTFERITTDGLAPAEYTHGVFTVNDSATAAIVIDRPALPAPADFDVSNVDPADVTVTQGDSVTINASVQNTGGREGTQVIEFRLNGSILDSREVTLTPEALTTVSFEDIDTGSLTPDEYTADIRSENDTETLSIAVTDVSEEGRLVTEITNTNGPVEEGETLEVTAEISNAGERAVEQEITFAFDGETVDNRTISLGAGKNETVTFSYQTGADDAGNRTVSVSSADDTASTTVSVTDLTVHWQVDFGAGEKPPLPPSYWPNDLMAALGNSDEGVTENPSLLRQENDSQLGKVDIVDNEFKFDDEGNPTEATVKFEVEEGAEVRDLHLAAFTLPGPFEEDEIDQQELFAVTNGTYEGGETGELTVSIPQEGDLVSRQTGQHNTITNAHARYDIGVNDRGRETRLGTFHGYFAVKEVGAQ